MKEIALLWLLILNLWLIKKHAKEGWKTYRREMQWKDNEEIIVEEIA